MTGSTDRRTSRRRFLRSSATAAFGSALAGPAGWPAVLAGPVSTQTLRVGLIGCGGRGAGAAANALRAEANVQLTAMADLFEGPMQTSLALLRKQLPDQVRVERERCFLGFDAYQRLIDSGVDVVLLTTPPAFRPEHLRAAVQAGKHAFVEITAGIDGPGVRSVLESSEAARQKQLSIVSGFCWRYDHALRAAHQQIRSGAIGAVRTVYSTYLRGSLSHKHPGPRPPGMGDVEWQIRDWYDHLWLSGDLTILLSGGHSVDKMSWWLDDVMPVKAVATGSRVFPAEGNTFDNGFVAYEYAGGIRGFLACRSQSGCYNENADYVIGSEGTCTIGRGRAPVIQGKNEWRYTGVQNNKYQTQHDELFAAIRSGRPLNDGPRMARSTLMAILGRMAAYTGQEVTWDQALHSRQSLVPDQLDWNTRLEPIPLAMPGITRLSPESP
ncbi:MAG: Gfo/Idh/MocA family oxidoreductase [Candidatus Anammoximicrobium sp.]|nr:Gfo/Idh/MocA family oxidoreductase [Candidatus Anammoximicrobium sp.]